MSFSFSDYKREISTCLRKMNIPIPQESHPLSWPSHWPRHHGHRKESRFLRSCKFASRKRSMFEGVNFVMNEVRKLGGRKTIISTNTAVKSDGTPYAGRRSPEDTGVAIYFDLKGKNIVFACDRWDRVEDNVFAIGKHIESIRAQERWGVGRIEQAFTGYAAPPAPIQAGYRRSWYEVIGCQSTTSSIEVGQMYRTEAKKRHPDISGGEESMKELNLAYEDFKRERGLAG